MSNKLTVEEKRKKILEILELPKLKTFYMYEINVWGKICIFKRGHNGETIGTDLIIVFNDIDDALDYHYEHLIEDYADYMETPVIETQTKEEIVGYE